MIVFCRYQAVQVCRLRLLCLQVAQHPHARKQDPREKEHLGRHHYRRGREGADDAARQNRRRKDGGEEKQHDFCCGNMKFFSIISSYFCIPIFCTNIKRSKTCTYENIYTFSYIALYLSSQSASSFGLSLGLATS